MNPFDQMYEGTPPWEIGRAQPFLESLESRGRLGRTILDVGCGTGENALFLANRGHVVTGVDFSTRAIGLARAKARMREADVRFETQDVLDLGALGATFDTLIDSGLFHVFTDHDRQRYVNSLSSVARPGTTLYLACFSDREPNWGGPRRVTRDEIRATFVRRWVVERISSTRFATRVHEEGAYAHLAHIVYVGTPVSTGN